MLLTKLYFLIAFAIEYPKKRLHIYFNSSFFVVIIDITSLFHYNKKIRNEVIYMQFSSRLPVAVHILLAIVEFDGKEKTTSTFLAGSVNVNPVIIRNTLGQLKSAGLVNVKAGEGGASLAKNPENISLLDVFDAVEKEESLFHFHENPNPECPVGKNVHAVLDRRLYSIQEAMQKQMASITLQDLINDMNGILEQ